MMKERGRKGRRRCCPDMMGSPAGLLLLLMLSLPLATWRLCFFSFDKLNNICFAHGAKSIVNGAECRSEASKTIAPCDYVLFSVAENLGSSCNSYL